MDEIRLLFRNGSLYICALAGLRFVHKWFSRWADQILPLSRSTVNGFLGCHIESVASWRRHLFQWNVWYALCGMIVWVDRRIALIDPVRSKSISVQLQHCVTLLFLRKLLVWHCGRSLFVWSESVLLLAGSRQSPQTLFYCLFTAFYVLVGLAQQLVRLHGLSLIVYLLNLFLEVAVLAWYALISVLLEWSQKPLIFD